MSGGRQYLPFSTKISDIPLIVYPVRDSNPLSEVYNPASEQGVIKHLQNLYTEHEGYLKKGTYHIVFSWALNKKPMTDIWIHNLDNWADSESGPLVSCITFSGTESTNEAGIASGDTLITLGREEELRRRSNSLEEYLDRKNSLPDYPDDFAPKERFKND